MWYRRNKDLRFVIIYVVVGISHAETWQNFKPVQTQWRGRANIGDERSSVNIAEGLFVPVLVCNEEQLCKIDGFFQGLEFTTLTNWPDIQSMHSPEK